MGTVAGQYSKNFAGLPNTNPYTDPDFVVIDDPGNTELAEILGGICHTPDTSTVMGFRLNPAVYTPGTILRAKVEAATTGGVRDGIWCGLMDASGNGYIVQVGNSQWIRYRMDAWNPHYDSGYGEPFTGADGDEAELEYNKSTGLVRVFRNGSHVSVLDLTNMNYAGNALAPAFFQRPGDLGQGGVRSFAADGVATGLAALIKLKQLAMGGGFSSMSGGLS